MKAWRDSASLILAARHGQKYNRAVPSFDYKLLFLKRHQNSSFMPGTYVFPGGSVDPADSNLKWHEILMKFGFDSSSFASLVPKATARPQIFKPRQNELPREISLRIAAIRETFEECGVLMCRQRKEGSTSWVQHMSIPKKELQVWQSKVHNNAAEFLTFCEKFECYPDVWALHEWSNWLTPSFMSKRFDTVFYLACIPQLPKAEYEAIEMEGLEWGTPEHFLSLSTDMLPVPQQYELTALMDFRSIDNLLDFAMKRSKMGVQLMYLVSVQLKDGVVQVLPGDVMYPKEVDFVSKELINKSNITIDEFQKITPIHRLLWLDTRMKIFRSDGVRTVDDRTTPESREAPHIKNKL